MNTPIELYDGVWVKRDDLYRHPSGARGAKARVMDVIAAMAMGDGQKKIVTAVARNSSIPAVVAAVGRHYGLAVSIHTALAGTAAPELAAAGKLGATIYEHRPGYQSVINARAAAECGPDATLVPLGLESAAGIKAVIHEVVSTEIPPGVRRIVMAVGSGMMISAVLNGTWRFSDIPVVGVCVGPSPERRIRACLVSESELRRLRLVAAGIPFGKPAGQCARFPFKLDPYYEAKAAAFLEPGDLFWIVAARSSCV